MNDDNVVGIGQFTTSEKQIFLSVTNYPDISFTGKLIAKTDTSELYREKSGKYICVKRDELLKHELKTCKNHDQVIQFYGYTDDAKSLYKQAGIDSTVVIRFSSPKQKILSIAGILFVSGVLIPFTTGAGIILLLHIFVTLIVLAVVVIVVSDNEIPEP